MLGHDGVDLGFLRSGKFAGIAALAAGIHAGLDECGAQRGNLFCGFRTNVIALDDGAETVRGGNSLEARDAKPHDKNMRGPDRARGRGNFR